jgi:orotate phosphoribosyltransferase
MINQETYNIYELAVHDYINNHCIVRGNLPGKFKGQKYNWMLYLRNGLFNPVFLQYVTEMMLFKLYNELNTWDFQICGAETAGTPLAASIPLIAHSHDIPMSGFVVRKDQKTYGLKNWHEGMAFSEIPYVLVDDLCNSSMSLKHADAVCKGLGLTPTNIAIVIVNKVNKKTHEEKRINTDMYLPKEYKVISLFDLDSFNLNNPSH